MNEESIKIMDKVCNIKFDKIIVLTDKSEEDPFKVLLSRKGFEQNCNLELEINTINSSAASLKELLTEDKVKEIDITAPITEVYNNIRTAIDPFFIRYDDESLVKVAGDINEEDGDFPLTWGEYGPYCPVTLKDEGWLVPGKEFEASVRGLRHKFFGEDQMNKFKSHVFNYV